MNAAGLSFFIPAALLLVATLVKLWALRVDWEDTLLRAVCAVLFVAMLVFVTAAPPTLAAINDATGIPNFAAPLVYCILTAFDGSCIVLLIHWRGAEDESRIRRATRLCLGCYGSVMVALWVLFALADAPVERLRDLDTYYASTPYMREMILLYLLAHTVAAVTMTVLCWKWSRQVPGALRVGLVSMAAGNVLTFIYDILKYTAIAARWFGHDLDWLSTHLAFSLAAFSAVLIGGGFLIPSLGQGLSSRWKSRQQYQQLKHLWQEVRPEIPLAGSTPLRWWTAVEMRQLQRERDIHDAILRMGLWFDHEVGQRVYRQAKAQGIALPAARIEADAAVIAAAMITKSVHPEGPQPLEKWNVTSTEAGHNLLLMSLAIANSPRVQDARENAARIGSLV